MKKIQGTSKNEYFISYRIDGTVDGALINATTAEKALDKLIDLVGEDFSLTNFKKL